MPEEAEGFACCVLGEVQSHSLQVRSERQVWPPSHPPGPKQRCVMFGCPQGTPRLRRYHAVPPARSSAASRISRRTRSLHTKAGQVGGSLPPCLGGCSTLVDACSSPILPPSRGPQSTALHHGEQRERAC